MEDIPFLDKTWVKGSKGDRKEPKKPIPEVMSEEEVYTFGKRYGQPYRCLFYLVYLTGARITEALELRNKDISKLKEGDKDILKVRLNTRKNRRNKWRDIPIPWSAIQQEVVLYIDALHREPEDYIFRDLYALRRGRSDVWEHFNREIIVVRAVQGTEYIENYELRMRPHYLRHCRATHLVNTYGMDSLYLMYFMGWTTPAPARVYASMDWRSLLNRMLKGGA